MTAGPGIGIRRGISALLIACGFLAMPASAQDAGGGPPPAFMSDSARAALIRAVEAGAVAQDTLPDTIDAASRRDSLAGKMQRRGPYAGFTAGIAFGNHSASDLFAAHMTARANAAGQRILQRQDPVHIFFPTGLLLGYPVFSHFDLWLRTEHLLSNPVQAAYTRPERLGYTITGLAQRDNEPAQEYAYTTQAHLAGLGARWLVPVSFLTVSGKPGLYAAYTHFWSFGTTGLRADGGTLAARTDPAGAGFEVQVGFQQDFDRRFAFTGGLAFSRLSFRSDADWDLLLDTAPADRAEWTLQSMRLVLQMVYQFGRGQ